MKQIAQNLGTGETRLIDVPRPACAPGKLVIDTRCSLVSVGTERMLVEFGRAGLLSKARQQPEKVRQVLKKISTDGLAATLDAVRSKLALPVTLGYSNVGVVAEVGPGVEGFSVGDRILSNGPHAETVCVPRNLCAHIPDGVADGHAAFGVVGAIALQGVRLAAPTIGESVVVIGAGLIGLLTVQILLANGCRVLAIDLDPAKLALARQFGADVLPVSEGTDVVAAARGFSGGQGVDAVLITASTKSNDPIRHAAQMSRKRGRIILVGVTGLQLSREEFYQKELQFQVSCSYGPGRYDPAYEQGGHDYPPGFVRWTSQRNFEAVLDLIDRGRIDVAPLISRRVPFEQASQALQELGQDKSLLGLVLDYARPDEERRARLLPAPVPAVPAGRGVKTGVIGAGNYASRVLLPALRQTGAALGPIITSQGFSGAVAAERFGFEAAGTDLAAITGDDSINLVVIATQHDSHAALAARMLEAGKDVFVEKPLALTRDELSELRRRIERLSTPARLMVGFNRRFAPLAQEMKRLCDLRSGPKSMILTMNAGAIPAESWVQDQALGGGRIIGEACHFVDLARFLAGHPIVDVQAQGMGANMFEEVVEDKATLLLRFADGSHAAIHYFANGSASFPKERVEVFAGGGILQLDNFRTLRGFGWPGFQRQRQWRQDKGQGACIAAFVRAIERGEAAPIAIEELMEVTEATISAAEMLRAQ